ncbi:MAG: hypothetical protein GY765_30555, partial [bacterium]|nr:hypothetical protein [bacterium]
MTLRNRCVIAILSILLALPALLRAEKPAGENKFLPRTFRLKAQLSLTNEQTARVEKLMKMVKSQTENDRQVFKGNSLALLEAAKRREQMVETHIGNLLTSEQTPVFKGLLKSKKARQEMFILRESLALNAKQIAAVQVILDKYREKLKKEFMEL